MIKGVEYNVKSVWPRPKFSEATYFFNHSANSIISNVNWTEWSTIQGVIGRVILKFEITSTSTPELYDAKSSYQLIVSTTKCEIRKSTSPARIYF